VNRSTISVETRVRGYLAARGLKPHDESTPVAAYVNHARWVADCPCGGAEMVREGVDMLCGSCGAVRIVIWPSDVEGIERALHVRDEKYQNWQVGEPVELLEVETVGGG